MLRCEQLEPRDPTVSLQLVPLLGFDSRPEWPVVVSAAVEVASRIRPASQLPAVTQPYTLYHAWGGGPGSPVPADTLRVYVGPTTGGNEYGVGAPGGWSASGAPLPRNWGGFVGIDPDAISRAGADVATVTRHEVLHVLGVGHTTDPAALMHPHLSPGTVKTLTHTDANLLESAGWTAVTISHMPGYARVFGHGDTPDGWVMYPEDRVRSVFPAHVRVPDGTGWAYAPPT